MVVGTRTRCPARLSLILRPFLHSASSFSLAVSPSELTHCDYFFFPSFLTLSVNPSSSPDNKKDKTKSAKIKPISNASLSESSEGNFIL